MTETAPRSGGPVKGRIVVGVDGSESSKAALEWAARQAALTGAELDVVGAWGYPVYYGAVGWPSDFDPEAIARQDLEKAIDEVVGQSTPLVVRTQLIQAHPTVALLDAAKDADLLVVGCRGHGEFAGMLLGSVSQHCVSHARCPVVVVHNHGDSDI